MNGFRVPITKIRETTERRLLLAVQDWREEKGEAIEVIEAACAWAEYRPKPRLRRAKPETPQ